MLEGLKAIAAHLGETVTPFRVHSLRRAGAPIRKLGGRGRGARYIADSDALIAWVRCEVGYGRRQSAVARRQV